MAMGDSRRVSFNQTLEQSGCPQNLLQTKLLIQKIQKYQMKMFADTIKLVSVSLQGHVGTSTLKIATQNALTDTLKHAGMVPGVKE